MSNKQGKGKDHKYGRRRVDNYDRVIFFFLLYYLLYFSLSLHCPSVRRSVALLRAATGWADCVLVFAKTRLFYFPVPQFLTSGSFPAYEQQ